MEKKDKPLVCMCGCFLCSMIIVTFVKLVSYLERSAAKKVHLESVEMTRFKTFLDKSSAP